MKRRGFLGALAAVAAAPWLKPAATILGWDFGAKPAETVVAEVYEGRIYWLDHRSIYWSEERTPVVLPRHVGVIKNLGEP